MAGPARSDGAQGTGRGAPSWPIADCDGRAAARRRRPAHRVRGGDRRRQRQRNPRASPSAATTTIPRSGTARRSEARGGYRRPARSATAAPWSRRSFPRPPTTTRTRAGGRRAGARGRPRRGGWRRRRTGRGPCRCGARRRRRPGGRDVCHRPRDRITHLRTPQGRWGVVGRWRHHLPYGPFNSLSRALSAPCACSFVLCPRGRLMSSRTRRTPV